MYVLNRKQRYELIKNILTNANIEKDPKFGDIKKQLLDYLDEMFICWNEQYIDVTDRQYIKIIDYEKKSHR